MRILRDFLDRHPGSPVGPDGLRPGDKIYSNTSFVPVAQFNGNVNGFTVRDRISGFRGVVIGRVDYLTGCSQALVHAGLDDKGEIREPQWLDLQRLEVDMGVDRIVLDNGQTPGFDRAPPKI